jgi:hypothetical protein
MLRADRVVSLLQSPFSKFVANPPIREEGSSSSHRARPSRMIEALIASY